MSVKRVFAWAILGLVVVAIYTGSIIFFIAFTRVLPRLAQKKASARLTRLSSQLTGDWMAPIQIGVSFASSVVATPLIIALWIYALTVEWTRTTLWFVLFFGIPLSLSGILLLLFIIGIKRSSTDTQIRFSELLHQKDEEIAKRGDETGPFAGIILWLLSAMSAAVLAPISILKEYFYLAFPRLNDLIPNPVLVWQSLLTVFSYRLELDGAGKVAYLLAIFVCGSAMHRALFALTTHRGVLAFFSQKTERMSPGRVLSNALIVAAAFGCIHLHLSDASSGAAYSPALLWEDAIYFSITTISTVGYGDIHPVSVAAKRACVAEILCGIVLLVIAVNVSITLWLEKNRPSPIVIAPSPDETNKHEQTTDRPSGGVNEPSVTTSNSVEGDGTSESPA